MLFSKIALAQGLLNIHFSAPSKNQQRTALENGLRNTAPIVQKRTGIDAFSLFKGIMELNKRIEKGQHKPMLRLYASATQLHRSLDEFTPEMADLLQTYESACRDELAGDNHNTAYQAILEKGAIPFAELLTEAAREERVIAALDLYISNTLDLLHDGAMKLVNERNWQCTRDAMRSATGLLLPILSEVHSTIISMAEKRALGERRLPDHTAYQASQSWVNQTQAIARSLGADLGNGRGGSQPSP